MNLSMCAVNMENKDTTGRQ